ncbi:MAG: LemA family protein [Gemmatimonadota bacterium]
MWELLVLVAVVGGGILIYNSLVKLREQTESAWSDIDVQLKRRYDLVPNLVETVRAYAGHEKETLESVIQARSRAMNASGPGERAEAEGALTDALESLFALSEDYPDLRAAENYRELQSTLSHLEDHIQRARRYYNAVVRDFNTRLGQVPSNIVARAFGFTEREFFEIPDEERVTPEVSFEEGSGA